MNRRQRKKFEQRNNTPAYDTYFANVLNTPLVSKHPANTALPSDPISLNLVPT